VRWGPLLIGLSFVVGCFAPDVRSLPEPPVGAQTLGLIIGSKDGLPKLTLMPLEQRALVTLEPEVIESIGYFAQPLSLFGTEARTADAVTPGCDRLRKMPASLASYRFADEWIPHEGETKPLYSRFSLPEIDFRSCDAQSGCLALDEWGLEICKPACKATAPDPPSLAECPDGWRPLEGRAVCTPPDPAPCSSDGCWLFADPSLCQPSLPPPGARVYSSTTTLPAELLAGEIAWLSRGTHRGVDRTIRLRAGAQLLGECPEATILEAEVNVLGDDAVVEGLTLRDLDNISIDIAPGIRGVAVRRVAIERAGIGVFLAGGSEATLSGIRIAESIRGIVVGELEADGPRHASLHADHVWLPGPGTLGIEVSASTATIEDLVAVQSYAVDGGGLAVVDGSTVSVDHAYLTADAPVVFVRSSGALIDVRIDGDDLAVHAAELAQVDAGLMISRFYSTRVKETGLWIRDVVGDRTSVLIGSDIVATDSRVGVTIGSSARLERILVERASRTGLELARNGFEEALDVTVRDSAEGIRVALESFPYAGTGAIERALVEGNEVGAFLTLPLPTLTDVAFYRNRVALGGDDCGARQVIGGARVSFGDNGQFFDPIP
jgi:hypothetical protein